MGCRLESSRDSICHPEPQQLDYEPNAFRASGSRKVLLHPSPNLQTTVLSGKFNGTITSCAKGFRMHGVAQTPCTHTMEETLPLVCLETRAVAQTPRPSTTALQAKCTPTGETIAEAHWRTLVANRWHHPVQGSQSTPPPAAFSELATQWVGLMQADDAADQYRWTTVDNDQFGHSSRMEESGSGGQHGREYYRVRAMERLASLFWKAMQAGVVGRCFCVVGYEYMGLAAPLAREGDVLAVFYGGSVLYVFQSF